MIKLTSTAASLVALLAVTASAANAQTPAPASAPAATAAASPAAGVDPGDRIVCRSMRYTGSRFPERECRTKRAWDQKGQAARQAVDDRIDGNRRNNVSGKDGAYKTHSGAPN